MLSFSVFTVWVVFLLLKAARKMLVKLTKGQLNTVEILTKNGWKTNVPVLPVKVDLHCMVQLNSTTVMLIGGIQVSIYPNYVDCDCFKKAKHFSQQKYLSSFLK